MLLQSEGRHTACLMARQAGRQAGCTQTKLVMYAVSTWCSIHPLSPAPPCLPPFLRPSPPLCYCLLPSHLSVGYRTPACYCLQGPAVWALRAQTDKLEYARVMRGVLESEKMLQIREVWGGGGCLRSCCKKAAAKPPLQGMVVGLDINSNDEVVGVLTYFGLCFRARSVVLTTGTFMNGRIWVGRQSMSAGRCVWGGVNGRVWVGRQSMSGR